MNEKDYKFPKIKKSIETFIDDQDGNITRSKLVTIGAMVVLMSMFATMDAYAAHRSHSSHESHSSTSYIRSHTNHGSHFDHGSHSSHSSHTSHSNTAFHSNSLYSSEGDVSYGPSVSKISTVNTTPQGNADFSSSAQSNTLDMSIPAIPDAPDPQDTLKIEKPDI